MPCYTGFMPDGNRFFICSDLGPHCSSEKCSDVSGFLCDFPVAEGKTCGIPLCASHAYEIAPNIHYCSAHLLIWNEFRDSGGVKRELSNVVPFKGAK